MIIIIKETRSVTMNIFRKKKILFKSIVKTELRYVSQLKCSVQL